jgi:putative membrane protein
MQQEAHMIVRILVTGLAVWLAAVIVPGVEITGAEAVDQVLTVLGVAVIFGLVNAVLGSVLRVLTLPFTILTLGLFALVVNALLLWITAAIAGALDLPFEVTGFWAAFLGALVVSIVRLGLSRATRET